MQDISMKSIYVVSDFDTYQMISSVVHAKYDSWEWIVTGGSIEGGSEALDITDPQGLILTVVVIDVPLYGNKAIELAQRCVAKLPDVPIILLTQHEEIAQALATDAGIEVAGFVDKTYGLGDRGILFVIEEAFQNTNQSAPEVALLD